MTHMFDVDVAMKFGVQCATFLAHIAYWIQKNEADGTNFYDGAYWTYASYETLEKIMPYMNNRQLRYCVKKLSDEGIISVGNYNKNPYDRTNWYSLTELGRSIVYHCSLDAQKVSDGQDRIGRAIPDISKDISIDISNTKTADNNNSERDARAHAYTREEICGGGEEDHDDGCSLTDQETSTDPLDAIRNEKREQTVGEYVSENLLPMSGGNWQALAELMDAGMTDELVRFAVDIAMSNGARTWAYVQSILNSWVCKNVRTLEDARREAKFGGGRRGQRKDGIGGDEPPKPLFYGEVIV